MQFWNHIIQVASLGTGKQQADIAEADEALHTALQRVVANEQLDAEESFLQMAALAFNYRQSGVSLQPNEQVSIQTASAEEKKYCSSAQLQLLKEIIDAESNALLELWLKACTDNNLIVTPGFIPRLFTIATANKPLQSTIAKCCGNRGEWLITYNSEWKFSASQNEEDIWNTGLSEQRRQVLAQIRTNDAAKAKQLLKETWDKEDANTKVLLLAVLENNISNDDIDFLEKLKSEKGKKVKELAFGLLKLIPSSSVIREYVQVLQQTLQIKKEKALLGLVSKKVLQVQLPEISKSVFESGIDKLSNIKGLNDELYIVQQLIANVPPSEIQALLQLPYAEVADLFLQQSPYLLTAFINAAIRFKETDCLRAILYKDKNNFYAKALSLLPAEEADAYCLSIFEQTKGSQANADRNNIINAMCNEGVPFSAAFSNAIVAQLAGNMYAYNKKFYSKYIHLFHATIISEAEKFQPKEQYSQSQWSNMADHLKHLLQLRLQIQSTFTLQKP